MNNNEKKYPNIPPEAPGEKTSFKDKGSHQQDDRQREQRSKDNRDFNEDQRDDYQRSPSKWDNERREMNNPRKE